MNPPVEEIIAVRIKLFLGFITYENKEEKNIKFVV